MLSESNMDSHSLIVAATPEVAADYDSNGTILGIVNAIYMLMMGISPMFWGPLSEMYGRRPVREPCIQVYPRYLR
jgi:MFS family permease